MLGFPLLLQTARLYWHARREAKLARPRGQAKLPSDTERWMLDTARATLLRAGRKLLGELEQVRLQLNRARHDRSFAGEVRRDISGTRSERTPTDRRLSRVARASSLVVLTLADGWFNKAAFEAFGESGPAAIGLTAVVALGLPLLAELFGQRLRQDGWTRTSVAGWSVVLLVVAATFLAMADLRSLVGMAEPSMMGAEGAIILPGSEAAAAPAWNPITPGRARAVFITLNCLVFVVAAVIGFYGSDSRAGFAEACRRLDRDERRLAALERAEAELMHLLRSLEDVAIERLRGRIRTFRMMYRRHLGDVPAWFDDPADPCHDPAEGMRGLLTGRPPRTAVATPATSAPDITVLMGALSEEHTRSFVS